MDDTGAELEFNYMSPRWSGELMDCSMPMTFDQFSNCGFSCAYCFSQYQRGLGGCKQNYAAHKIKAVDPVKFKRMFTEPDTSQFGPYIRARKVMQWGGLSDPFCSLERKHGVGLELLRFLREIDYPVCFSTKGTWWVKDERYAELFRNNPNWNVKVSIITTDLRKYKLVERGVATPSARLDTIEAIAAFGGGGATLRLRPFIIGVSSPGHMDLILEAGRRGAKALSTEFFCYEARSPWFKQSGQKLMSEACGFDIAEFYKQYSTGSGYLRLNRNIKRPYVDQMEQACKDAGMRFYVSDAHFKERCANGCCCGLPPSWNYSRGQFTEAIQIAKQLGEVNWNQMEAQNLHLANVPWGGAVGFNTNSSEKRALFQHHTLLQFMRWTWNHPNAGQSPYKMFGGILKPARLDEQGNVVYVYDSTKV